MPAERDGLVLASLDAFPGTDPTGTDQLSAAELRGQMLAAGEDFHAPAHQEGADRSDSVWVSADARGRVQSVEISRRWRERLDPDGFAPALLEAYTAAERKVFDAAAMQAFAEQRRAAAHGTAGYPAADERTDGMPWRGSDPFDEAEWLAATWDTLDEVGAELSRLTRLDTTGGMAGGETTVSSPHGYLTLRVLGRAVVGISGDVRHIRVCDPEQLRREAIAAFQAAESAADG